MDYASGLSEYQNKGVCGLPEVGYISPFIPTISYRVVVGTTLSPRHFFQEFDPPDKLTEKVCSLVQMLSSAQHTVVHTGAGVSTAAGQNIHNSITYLCQFRIKIRLPAFCSR